MAPPRFRHGLRRSRRTPRRRIHVATGLQLGGRHGAAPDDEKADILATLAYVQNEILAAYEEYIHDITARRFPAPTALICPTTQEDYETIYSEMAKKLPLVAYRQVLKMLHMRLGLPIVAVNTTPEREEILS